MTKCIFKCNILVNQIHKRNKMGNLISVPFKIHVSGFSIHFVLYLEGWEEEANILYHQLPTGSTPCDVRSGINKIVIGWEFSYHPWEKK